MKVVMAALCIALLCGFSGCQSFGTEEQQVEASCATATAAIRVLAIAKAEGKVSEEMDQKVLAAADVTDPVCLAEEPTWKGTPVGDFQAAVAQLLALRAQVE